MFWFVIGIFLGCLVGTVVMACLSADAYRKGFKEGEEWARFEK
jgi:purine-cytosine permease-like protein